MYDQAALDQNPYAHHQAYPPNIRAACRGDCLNQQTHRPEPYQQYPLIEPHQAARLSSTHQRRVLPRQSESSPQHRPPRQLQTAFPRHISPMTDAWVPPADKVGSHDMDSQYLSSQQNNDWPSDIWSDPQHIPTGHAYLDPRKLQIGVNSVGETGLGLGVHELTQQDCPSRDFGHPQLSPRYASPPCPFEGFAPHKNHRAPSRQATPYDISPARDIVELDTDADDEDATPNEPYNQLLHRCLLQQPHHELLLKDIYEWFKLNTDKGRDPRQKGWQNSIRHNLSMNPAFHKGSRSQPDASITNMWSLTDKAIAEGVEPTTRFRNHNRPFQRGKAWRGALPQHQLSGAKGGRAARRSTRLRTLATPEDSRSPSPAPAFFASAQNPEFQPHTGFIDAKNASDFDTWHLSYSNGSGGPYYFNSTGNDQTCSSSMPGTSFVFPNQFDDSNNFTCQSDMSGLDAIPASQTSHPSYIQQPQGITDQMDGYDGKCQSSPQPASNTPSLMNCNVSGAHSDASGEPLFTNSGDEDSSAEVELPKTPQLGESINRYDEGEGLYFNLAGKD